MLKSYFGVFTHWILREFDTSLYLTECYDNFVDFKWEIPAKDLSGPSWADNTLPSRLTIVKLYNHIQIGLL